MCPNDRAEEGLNVTRPFGLTDQVWPALLLFGEMLPAVDLVCLMQSTKSVDKAFVLMVTGRDRSNSTGLAGCPKLAFRKLEGDPVNFGDFGSWRNPSS
mmetsp:Transcript_96493/g.171560  ORF Transcript_96493/g.171560 Transcript_96493/m.171560 type:complete len:98 (+) Transcript_96493:821-1114(+)